MCCVTQYMCLYTLVINNAFATHTCIQIYNQHTIVSNMHAFIVTHARIFGALYSCPCTETINSHPCTETNTINTCGSILPSSRERTPCPSCTACPYRGSCSQRLCLPHRGALSPTQRLARPRSPPAALREALYHPHSGCPTLLSKAA